MNWLSEFLKHLEVSKAITGAVFITSLVFLVAPHLYPNVIDMPPKQWQWIPWVLCIFSGSLLAIWALASAWTMTGTFLKRFRRLGAMRSFLPGEQQFLMFLGRDFPSSTANLDRIGYTEVTKLETLEICRSLRSKGYLHISMGDDNYVSLTPAGRQEALALIRQANSVGRN